MPSFASIFQVAVTQHQAADASCVHFNMIYLIPVPCNVSLLHYSHELLFHHFPLVNHITENLQRNQIALGLSSLYQQKEEHHQAARAAQEANNLHWLGTDICQVLHCLSQVLEEAEVLHIWHDLAKVIKATIQMVLCKMGQDYLQFNPIHCLCQKDYISQLDYAQC